MTVPTNRLLWAFAVIAIPAGFIPPPVSVAMCALLLAAAVGDALIAMRRVNAVKVVAPEVVRFTRARDGVLPLTMFNSGGARGALRIGVRAPAEIGCELPLTTVEAPARGERREVRLPCKPKGRGAYNVRSAALGLGSPLGLWEARKRMELRLEVRVYPDLLTGQEGVAPLLLRRRAGMHVQRQVGRGREFDNVREYFPGDPMSDIHWKATARRARPVTRVYRIERTQEIYAVLDCSRLTGRAAGDDTVLERYVSAALALTAATQREGDQIGLVTFSETVHSFLRAGSGAAHIGACRNLLVDITPRAVAPGYAEVTAALATRLRRRALLCFLTELDDPAAAEDFEEAARELSQRHLVTVASVRQPYAAPVFERDAASLDEVYERLAGHMAWRRSQEIAKRLRAVGVHYAVVRDSHLGAEVARAYLNVKQQQAL